mmetsp:Transcript_78545/g.155603  ORF Transcript_78545/g.155603 Transcript_78545/m.155603 type:complete len:235 (-) Transcript_78545:181-885(-)
MSKLMVSPARKFARLGFDPLCTKRSPWNDGEMMKPQSSLKLRITPSTRAPTKLSGLMPIMPIIPAAASGLAAAIICAIAATPPPPTSLTLSACMPLWPLSSGAIWNSTCIPCVGTMPASCLLPFMPKKMSPSKRLELRRPHWSLKLLTQPVTVWPTSVATSSFMAVTRMAWQPPDEFESSWATSNCMGSPAPIIPMSGFDFRWKKRSPTKLSELMNPHGSRKLLILPISACPMR